MKNSETSREKFRCTRDPVDVIISQELASRASPRENQHTCRYIRVLYIDHELPRFDHKSVNFAPARIRLASRIAHENSEDLFPLRLDLFSSTFFDEEKSHGCRMKFTESDFTCVLRHILSHRIALFRWRFREGRVRRRHHTLIPNPENPALDPRVIGESARARKSI